MCNSVIHTGKHVVQKKMCICTLLIHLQKHLLDIRSGRMSSRYVTEYHEKSRTMAGRWQLKQMGFGPMERYRMVRYFLCLVFSVTFLAF